MEIEDIAQYDYENDFAVSGFVYLIIKGFEQERIDKKIIERKGNRAFGLTYLDNTEKRKYSKGLIAKVPLDRKKFSISDFNINKIECLEPFSLSFYNKNYAYNSGSEIIIVDAAQQKRTSINYDWLSFVHSLEYSKDGKYLLASSAGFDTIIEFEVNTGSINWEWNLWDNGFNFSPNANTFISIKKQYSDYFNYNKSSNLLVQRSQWPDEGIPTFISPTRLNGASYFNDLILFTCFHRPELFIANRNGFLKIINYDLKHPHNFKTSLISETGFVVTDSGRGRFLTFDKNLIINKIYDFSNLESNENKKKYFGEWIQSVSIKRDKESILFAIDTLRNGIHLVDINRKIRRFINVPTSWTIQECLFSET